MNTSLQTILDSPGFNSFLTAAKAFCNFIEHSTATGKTFVVECQDHLLNLYSTSRKLTDTGLSGSDEKPVDLTDKERKVLLESISDRMPFQYYWIALDPILDYEHGYQEGVGDVTDDVMDIYLDIKPALSLFDGADGAKIEALWHLKFDFDEHWNDHCINALHAIHHYLEKHKYDE